MSILKKNFSNVCRRYANVHWPPLFDLNRHVVTPVQHTVANFYLNRH